MTLESDATVYEDADSLTYVEEDTHKANVSASELAHNSVLCSHMFSIFPCSDVSTIRPYLVNGLFGLTRDQSVQFKLDL
jgi:hypothetical protein